VNPQVIFCLFVLFAGAVLPNVTRDILKQAISLLETENPSVSILFKLSLLQSGLRQPKNLRVD
jgi:hypothetical protein